MSYDHWNGEKDMIKLLTYSSDFPVELTYMDACNTNRHWHSDPQIIFVLSGALEIALENESYAVGADHLLLVNANQIHEIHSSSCSLFSLIFNCDWFHPQGLWENQPHFSCNSVVEEDQTPFFTVKQLIAYLIKVNCAENKDSFYLNCSILYHLFYELLSRFRTAGVKADRSRQNTDRLNRILEYLNQNYTKPLTLGQVADMNFLSSSYLSHYFEKQMGMTFTGYLNKLRLERSLSPLLNTRMSIESVAELCGFRDARAYTRFFKLQYGMLPSRYRKLHSGSFTGGLEEDACHDSQSLQPLYAASIMDNISIYFETSPELLHSVPTVRTDDGLISMSTAKSTGQMADSFGRLFHLGHIKNILSGVVQDMVLLQQKEIAFDAVYLTGIFDDSMMVYQAFSLSSQIYNYSLVDDALDFLVTNRLQPVINLSYMPRSLARNPERILYINQSIFSLPRDFNLWSEMVRHFVLHIIKRYGLEEILKWDFTVWNEVPASYTGFQEFENDFDLLYQYTWEAVKSCSPDLKFILPPCTMSEDVSGNFRRLVQFSADHNCMPDSYGISFYPLVPSTAGPTPAGLSGEALLDSTAVKYYLHEAPDILNRFALRLSAYLEGIPKKPVILLDWGFSPWNHELLNDTCFAGTYILKNVIENQHSFSTFPYSRFTDWGGLIDDKNSLFHGGNGIFARNGIRKPSYFAYSFLRLMKKNIISQGEGYLVTADQEVVTALFYNYCHFSELYAQGVALDMDFINRYQAFPNARSKALTIRLTALNAPCYTLREHIVNRQYGSCFDIWVSMGASTSLSRNEEDQLKALSAPFLRSETVTPIKKSLTYTARLAPHEMRLVEFYPDWRES